MRHSSDDQHQGNAQCEPEDHFGNAVAASHVGQDVDGSDGEDHTRGEMLDRVPHSGRGRPQSGDSSTHRCREHGKERVESELPSITTPASAHPSLLPARRTAPYSSTASLIKSDDEVRARWQHE